ncbi:MAG: carboxypeptidase-like regulatory domain-containing protein, partial [Sphingobacteriaceae bacterium]
MNRFFYSLSALLIFLTFNLRAQAQQNATIRGHITTSDNKPADFVSVVLNDKSQGTLTNANGDFVFHKLRAGNYIIKVSAVGLSAQTKEISLNAAQVVTVNFMLNENAEQLKEVNINASKTNKFIIKQSETVGKMPLTQLENPQVYT